MRTINRSLVNNDDFPHKLSNSIFRDRIFIAECGRQDSADFDPVEFVKPSLNRRQEYEREVLVLHLAHLVDGS